jgi:fructose-bisphosphate aldolase / 2-amino-3,7-dideoxy-D-threo-hept-6-ulosonate synthase
VGSTPGHQRRLARLLPPDRPAIWHAVDDALIAGPEHLLRRPDELFSPELMVNVDAVLGFRGSLGTYVEQLADTPLIMNLTASTVYGDHTRKVRVGSLATALRMGADAVACHVNVSAPGENEMLQNLSRIVEEAEELGVPVLAIVYPRGVTPDGRDDDHLDERWTDRAAYTRRVRHAVRVAVELGASAVKTTYTGSVDSFATVVDGACGVPVLIAGERWEDAEAVFERAAAAVEAGAHGVAFGRQVFERDDRAVFVEELKRRLGKARANRSGQSPTT